MDPYNTADGLNPRPQPAAPAPATAAPANPYSAPYARVADVRDAAADAAPASRLSRLIARIVDVSVVAGPLFIVAVMGYQRYASALRSGGDTRAAISSFSTVLIVAVVLWVLALGIYNWVLLYRNGQTIGKRMMGVRIVRTDGSRASLKRIVFLRGVLPGLMGIIPFVGRFAGLIDALFIFRSDKRCIHDLFADTIVVDA
jgi:uncharacterized RDD family membrane protein YckC